jgi:exodeoxyribonuclease VII large subunit
VLPVRAPTSPRVEPQAERPVLSVAELDRRLKSAVERATDDVEVEGEISGLKLVASGHAYFCLKDEREDATIDCVMYRTAPVRARRLLVDGARVVVRGRATVYVARGRLQLIAENARPAGRGALLEALEQLKTKLAGEGLFARERKRELPADPRVIGVVTSADGAAIHDIVKVAARRGAVRIVLARAPVQGPGAAARIVRAIAMLERVPEIEAIIVGRGGGSVEDLSAYNDEALVRKIASARVPVVSAVGHEIDVSLTDLAADARAATPSQAAELLVPDDASRREALEHLERRLRRAMRFTLTSAAHRIERLRTGLGRPERLVAERQQALDESLARLRDLGARLVTRRRAALTNVERRLAARHPRAVLAEARAALAPMELRLASAVRRAVAADRRRLAEHAARLDALSPLAVLGRGYAIATREGRALVDAADVAPGDRVEVRLHRGAIVTEVVETTGDLASSRRGADEESA